MINTCNGIHHKTIGFWCQNVRLINGDDIKYLVDDQPFWEDFMSCWEESKQKRKDNMLKILEENEG